MPTTTNYGWTTPADTDLVKDGASAIRTLGSSIDTTTKNLNPQTTTGAIAYRSSTSNINTSLPIGTAGQILTVNSGATAPEWATPSSGGMTLISTASLSAATAISFTSIPSTYKHLKLVMIDLYQSLGSVYWTLQFNSASGYSWVTSNLRGTVTDTTNAVSGTAIGATAYNAPIPATYIISKNGSCSGTINIYNYTSTSLLRAFDFNRSGYDGVGGLYMNGFANGVYDTTGTAITRLDFTRSSTQTITGTIQLWGVS